MATLTDEEKAKAIAGDVEEETPAEPTSESEAQPEEEKAPEAVEIENPESEEEKPQEETEQPAKPADSTFTKQFPNLKGETPEEYLPELEKAYDNSFKEALRLKKEIDDNKAIVDQAKRIVEQSKTPVQQTASPTPPVPTTQSLDDHPAIQYAKAKQTEDMLAAFEDFKKDYPQAIEQQNFDALTKASDGISAALTSTLGRRPTYNELFPAIAGSLGWQPVTDEAKKNNAIKENASSGRAPGNQSAARPKPSKVSNAQIDAYLKMYTSKTREEAVKELSEVV